MRLCLCLLVSLGVASLQGKEMGKHLFVLSGQSNMKLFNHTHIFLPEINRAFGKDNVIIVKDSEGGQPIWRWVEGWQPSSGQPPKVTGDLYQRLIAKVKAAIEGEDIETVTLIWMQGEGDAKRGHGDVYAASLERLFDQLRRDLGRDDIYVVIGRISDTDMQNVIRPDWTMVRDIQVQVAESNPHYAWVDTDDLNGSKNDIHYTREGYRLLGERFAVASIELIHQAQFDAAMGRE